MVRWCHEEANLSNGLTKETAKTGDGCVWSLAHEEEMVSARKRRQQGKLPLGEETTCPKRDLDNIWVGDWLTYATHQKEPTLKIPSTK